jgi:DNA-binding transcriptional MerR regulator/methylmalonyl-CoA mutase cobalamin-binding subunit
MPKASINYPIRAVSLMTGVSIDTLRAWERRYDAVTPVRDNRGRVYSAEDVRRITLLRDAVQNGHAIGRVASMATEQLAQLSATTSRNASPAPAGRSQPASINTDSIIAALERFDAAAVESELGRAAAMLRAAELLRDVLVPVLIEVGERWHSGQGRIAHEHMLSASVRNVLGSLLRVHMREGVPDTMLFATPSGERHEFGTLGAAMLAASGGLGTIYLGPDMPAADIVAVAAVVRLEIVVLGVTDTGDTARVDKEVRQIAKRLPPAIELWLGGRGAERMAKALEGRALALPGYDAFEQQLVRVGARF